MKSSSSAKPQSVASANLGEERRAVLSLFASVFRTCAVQLPGSPPLMDRKTACNAYW
jgi:hypothetical protein